MVHAIQNLSQEVITGSQLVSPNIQKEVAQSGSLSACHLGSCSICDITKGTDTSARFVTAPPKHWPVL